MISSSKRVIQKACVVAAILFIPQGLLGQLTPAEKAWVGDTPELTPPLPTDLSRGLTRKNVSHAIEQVTDWELARGLGGLSPRSLNLLV
jgi:hypothetical protein